MAQENPTRQICRHCGGFMLDKIDEISCVMCGRREGHQCERCLITDDEKPANEERPKTSARKTGRKGKKAAA